jgi:tetratricopeptide (TPR) repeat protein
MRSDLVVAVLGAGVSLATVRPTNPTARVLSWEGLLRHGTERCVKIAPEKEPDLKHRWSCYDAATLTQKTNELVTLAKVVIEAFGGQEAPAFERWITEAFQNVRPEPGHEELIMGLAATGITLITTNYDTLIEQVTGLPGYTIDQQRDVERVIAGVERGVVHLHGIWTKPRDLIIDWQQYYASPNKGTLRTLLENTRYGHSLLLVGFGSGITDPNFSPWFKKGAEQFPTSSFKSYQLLKEDEFMTASAVNPLTPVCYGDRFDDLPKFIRKLKDTSNPFLIGRPAIGKARSKRIVPDVGDSSETVGQARYEHLPTVPHCFGRDEVLSRLVCAATASGGTQVLIYGPPGIGKGTIGLQTLRQPELAAQFTERRYRVRCESTESLSTFIAALADALRIPAAPSIGALRDTILSELQAAPSALFLDNFETPFLGEDRQLVEELLSDLVTVPGLSLLVAWRGSRPPPVLIKWKHEELLEPLNSAATKEAFLAIAGTHFAGDPALNSLLDAMDGLPLAIRLIAFQARFSTSLSSLWLRWQEHGHRVLARVGGGTREASLATSLAVTFDSEWMQVAQKDLLSILAFFPDGMTRVLLKLTPVADPDGVVNTLLQLGLIADAGVNWLRLLAPIRDYVLRSHAQKPEGLDALVRVTVAYGERRCRLLGTRFGLQALYDIRPVLANLEAAIGFSLRRDFWLEGAAAARIYASVIRFSGLGSRKVLGSALSRAKQANDEAESSETMVMLANLWRSIGDIDRDNDNLVEAAKCYASAQSFAHRVAGAKGDRIRADLLRNQGDIALARNDLQEAERCYSEARDAFVTRVYDLRRAEHCEFGRARIMLRRGNLLEAMACIEASKSRFPRLGGSKRTIARCWHTETEILAASGIYRRALNTCIKALLEYSPTGDFKSCKQCMSLGMQLVESWGSSSEQDTQFRHYLKKLAQPGLRMRSHNFTFGHLHAELAAKADSSGLQKLHFQAARSFWMALGSRALVGWLERQPGYPHERSE